MQRVRKHRGFSIVTAPAVPLFALVLLVWLCGYEAILNRDRSVSAKEHGCGAVAVTNCRTYDPNSDLDPRLATEFVQWWTSVALDYCENGKNSRGAVGEWMTNETIVPFQKVFFAERPKGRVVFKPCRLSVRASQLKSAEVMLQGVFASVDDRENLLDFADFEFSLTVLKDADGLRISGFCLTPIEQHRIENFFSNAEGRVCHLFALDSPSQLRALQYLSLAKVCLNSNDLSGCLANVDLALKTNSTCAQAHAVRGVALGRLGKLVAADSECDWAVRMNPNDFGSYFYRAIMRDNTGNFKGALSDYDFLVDHARVWWRFGATHNRGNVRSTLGDRAGAIADYTAAIALEPSSAYSYAARATEREEMGLNELAMNDHNSAISIDPRVDSFYKKRGYLSGRLGDYEAAKRDFSTVLSLNPTSDAYVDRGFAREISGDIAGAIDDYTKATLLFPVQFKAYSYRGWAKRKNDLKSALADLDKGILMDPAFPWHYLARKYVRRELGDTSGAIADLDTYLGLKPDYAFGYKERAELNLSAGRLSIALNDFKKSVKIDPKLLPGYVGCAEVSLKLKQHKSALRFCNAGIAQFLHSSKERDTFNAYILYGMRSWLYAKSGNEPLAIADLKQMQVVEPVQFEKMRKRKDLESRMKKLVAKVK